VKSWRDSDGDGTNDTSEAWGTHTNNPVYLQQDETAIHITLSDPDADGDGLADWVETGTGVYSGPQDTGTSSSTNDTDGDGILDGAEVTARTDPNDADVTAPTITINLPADQAVILFIP